MSDLAEMQKLLAEIAGLVKAGTKVDKRHAADKLNQLAAIAITCFGDFDGGREAVKL